MELPFFGGSKSIVGLDIGSSTVKAVELSVKPKGVELLRIGTAALPPEAIVQGAFLNASAIVDAIKAALAKGGIKCKNVAAAVAGPSVIVKKVSLPSMSREELEESIKWEAEQYIPFDINEVNLDFQILGGEMDDLMEVLLVAAKKELIDDYVALVSDAGLRPMVIDVAGFAVANAFAANYDSSSDEVIALVNIGAQMVNINVLAGGVPTFTRDIATGGNQLTEELQKSLSLSYEDAERAKLGDEAEGDAPSVPAQDVEAVVQSVTETVLGEISRSLDFYSATAADNQISRVILSGGASRSTGMMEAFHEKTNLPVEMLNPFARMIPNSKFEDTYLDQMGPQLGVSVGLALRSTEAG